MDYESENGLIIPKYIYSNLYPHQKICLNWLWNLHNENVGGILGDEMGLGKTVQICAFLGSLVNLKIIRLILLISPASVLLHWVQQLHKWYPKLYIYLLHASGSISMENDIKDYKPLFNKLNKTGGIVLATYESIRRNYETIININWDYVILDEGHRIRNPDAEITLICKQFKTFHRIILTGSPIQNNLKELWSLFDFIYPGRLGTLPTFENEFILPINTGGNSKATNIQSLFAYKCAMILRNLIHPYLLRRMKKDVFNSLNKDNNNNIIESDTRLMSLLPPDKTEQIIFCKMTNVQKNMYVDYLRSNEVISVLSRSTRPFRAINILRMICNHPLMFRYSHNKSSSTLYDSSSTDNVTRKKRLNSDWDEDPITYDEDYFKVENNMDCSVEQLISMSGKLIVLDKILKIWNQEKHRVLIFSQTTTMLDILETYLNRISLKYKYSRLDGSTTISKRQQLIDEFNDPESDVFVFLLTTKAGGVGVNLTGADRVIIYDPDWNPSTDMQARERAWRFGQNKKVTIYRLITCGTIEEKIYHRQIYKQNLTAKILNNPKKRQKVNKSTLKELFTFSDEVETQVLFENNNATDTYTKTEEFHDFLRESAVKIVKVDGSNIMNPCQDINTEEDDEIKSDNNNKDEVNSENNLLKKLFDGEDIKSVFNHDHVESDTPNQSANLYIEKESSKAASNAYYALKRSIEEITDDPNSGTPTWTGKNGISGNPSIQHYSKRRKLDEISQNSNNTEISFSIPLIKNYNNIKNDNTIISNNSHTISDSKEAFDRLMSKKLRLKKKDQKRKTYKTTIQIRHELIVFLRKNNIKNNNQGTTSEEILSKFNDNMEDKYTFRDILRNIAICTCRRWKLKS